MAIGPLPFFKRIDTKLRGQILDVLDEDLRYRVTEWEVTIDATIRFRPLWAEGVDVPDEAVEPLCRLYESCGWQIDHQPNLEDGRRSGTSMLRWRPGPRQS